MFHRPHLVSPEPNKIRVAFAYKNLAACRGISEIGLGVAGVNTQKVLTREGIWVDIWPVTSAAQINQRLLEEQASAYHLKRTPVSHVVIFAPWVPTLELYGLVRAHTDVEFAVLSHSNVGFLQADPNGVKLLRDAMGLETATSNFHLAGNCQRFCDWVRHTYKSTCQFLPNLYDMSQANANHRLPWDGQSPLRIGCFGAPRVQKNFITAVAAAMEIGQHLRKDTEIWVSSGRPEGANSIWRAIQEMVQGVKGIKLVENKWEPWPEFRRTVAHMDLLLQPSYTESYNIVSADGVVEGVPSVVSHAIDWAPHRWKAEVDSAGDVCRVGVALLHDPHAVEDGRRSLETYNNNGIKEWKSYLQGH
jgi:hypothetical protein